MTRNPRESDMASMMKAAVVREFGRPLVIEEMTDPGSRSRPDPGEVSRRQASATPTCMPPMATGRSSPSPPSSPAMRASGYVSAKLGSGVLPHQGRRPRRRAVAATPPAAAARRACTGWETLCTVASRTPAIRSMAPSPNTAWPIPTMSAVFRTMLEFGPAARCALRRRHGLQGPEGNRREAR